MSDHEHDEDGNCIALEESLPVWRWSNWDLVGLALVGAANVLGAAGHAIGLLSRECMAMANWERSKYDEQQARKAEEARRHAVAEDLRALIEGDPT